MNISKDDSYQRTYPQGFQNYFKLLLLLPMGVNRLLAMAKDTRGICPIIISKVFLQLIS
jgi:hypothetical protein